HTDSFLLDRDIPTFKMARVRCRFALQGGSAANSPPRFAPMWQCAGAHQAVGAGTPGDVQWTLATRSQLKSTTWAFQLPGFTNSAVHEVNGLVGNCVITGSAREGLLCDFDGTGLYQHLQESDFATLYSGTWSGGTNNANKFILSGA